MPAMVWRKTGSPLSESLARALNREVAGKHGQSFRRRLIYAEAGRRWVGAGKSPGSRQSREDAARNRRRRSQRLFLHRMIAIASPTMKANGGLISRDNLAASQAKERQPVRGTYRG